ncbi:hypothetical protein L596_023320 [Steinernema carpocapsae]|uniref:Phospholipase A2 domain-containing protein n=1 Tax=Steinernema carpocapsae TaxID=34508 RepID=A0A4U5MDB4_STECR|nr:hypothetical protein L596_023320 [Steinernema carpocapsae]
MPPIQILLFVASIAAASAFTCGSGPFSTFFAKSSIQLDCPEKMDLFDRCCNSHDQCYDAQRGRARCDDIFCACLQRAARGSKPCERTDGPAFCWAVRKFGGSAYRASG